jgi:diguanylate cyclase (GGDEF)-like protein
MLRRGDLLEIVAGPNMPRTFAEALSPGVKIAEGMGSCGTAAYRGEPVIVTDIETDPLWSDFRDLAARHCMKACWSVPIFSGEDKVLGTVAVYHSQTAQPVESELELLQMASRLATIALDHRQLLADLERQAKYDPLTALPNRFLFEDRLDAALDTARSRTARLALLWIDLDRFKEINDTLGHRIGDVLLRQAAERLSRCCRSIDTLARMGGDEFALLLPQLSGLSTAQARAESILSALRTPFHIEGYELYVTASIGICLYPDDGLDSATLQGNADRAMYRAKSRGRNGYHCYEQQIGVGALERLNLESNMRHALERNEFELFYQPQLDLSGKLKGFEGLIRWNHPKHGLLCPGHFISIAEESGLIVPIGDWVVKQACRQIALWRHKCPGLKIAVNVSALQFYYADFVETVREALADAQIEPSCLEIELTETLVMRNFEESRRQLEKLRSLGISIAIDDFGTGYSCLSNLQRLPVNTLKIDRSFLTDIEHRTNAAVVTAITMLSRSLGLSVVAEGIEKPEQLEAIKKIGVDLLQGYLLGRPAPADITESKFFDLPTC